MVRAARTQQTAPAHATKDLQRTEFTERSRSLFPLRESRPLAPFVIPRYEIPKVWRTARETTARDGRVWQQRRGRRRLAARLACISSSAGERPCRVARREARCWVRVLVPLP